VPVMAAVVEFAAVAAGAVEYKYLNFVKVL
jgi:hypothetical protein